MFVSLARPVGDRRIARVKGWRRRRCYRTNPSQTEVPGWSDPRFAGPPYPDPTPALVSGALTERFASRRSIARSHGRSARVARRVGVTWRILAGLPPADSSAPEKTPCSGEAKHSVPVPGSNHTIEY